MPTPPELTAYPLRQTLSLRHGDIDANHHLNNVVQARLFEEGAATLQRRALPDWPARATATGAAVTIAERTVRFLSIGSYPEPVELGTGVARIGQRSFVLEQLLTQQGRALARCTTAFVYLQEGKATALPDDWRAALAAWPVAAAAGGA